MGAEKRKNAVNRRERDAPARGEDGIGRAERKRLGNGMQVRLNDVKVIKDFKDLKDFNPKPGKPEEPMPVAGDPRTMKAKTNN